MNGQMKVGEAEQKVMEYGSESMLNMSAEGKGKYGS